MHSDGLTLVNDLNALTAYLSNAIDNMEKRGIEYAKAEATYKVKLKQTTLQLRDQGMAVGVIEKVVHGYCANERMERDIAETMYKTAIENINATKLRIRITNDQIDREWSRT